MKAVIPVAGNGTRMHPFTKNHSKELYKFMNKPVIDYVIKSLNEYAGVKDYIFVIGDDKHDLIEHLNDGSNYGKDITFSYVYQKEKKGLAHAIYQAMHLINNDFIVHVGDSFIHPMSELTNMINTHKSEKPFATIIAPKVENPTLYGVLQVDESNNLTNTIEKPSIEEAEEFRIGDDYIVNMGIYIFNPKFFKYFKNTKIGKQEEYQVPDVLKTAMKKEEVIKCTPTNGEYVDLGNWNSIKKAKKYFSQDLKIKKEVN